jgi:hypothetical protein
MTRHPAFAAGFARFFARPFVRGALLMRRFATLRRDISLLPSVHRCEPTIFFCHVSSSAPQC